ncbi:MAG TPA: M48 family metallopeptidase, partial [Bacteroidia bacterium]|nr:M48 family metallopeptidase [Bacteroidia bacterium]
MGLKARYFDGIIREGRDAAIEPLSEKLKIQPKGEGYSSPVYWEVKDITRIRHHKPGMSMLQNTASPKEYLELSAEDFDQQIAVHYRGHAFAGPVVEKVGSVWKPVLIVAAIIIGGLSLLYFLVVPWVSERFAYVVPKETEVSIGETMFKNTIAGYTINDSATVTINKFFQQIRHPQDYTIKITVVKEPQVNAFAMPGGNIVVFDGILKQMDSYPQLAALLGHEFSHVQYRHTTRSIFRSLGNYLFFAA